LDGAKQKLTADVVPAHSDRTGTRVWRGDRSGLAALPRPMPE